MELSSSTTLFRPLFMSLLSKTISSFSRQVAIARTSALRSQLTASARVNSTPRYTRAMASQQIPKTMKGVIIEKTGGTEVLQYKTDLPVPEPKEGQILVKNEFIGVNFIDTYFRIGLYPPPSFPYTLGREAAGHIISVGPSGIPSSLTPGTRIAYLGLSAYAEYTAVPVLHATPIPEKISSQTAAAALLQGLTALTLVKESYAVKEGEWALVHAAAGGTGLWLVQLLRSIGARTIATASTATKRELAKKAGAEVLIDYTTEDVPARVAEITDGKGVSVVYDGVGKSTFDASLACLARRGSMISFGNASGAPDPLTIARLSPKNLRVMRPAMFGYVVTREEFEYYAQELFRVVGEERLDVRVHKVYSLEEVVQAHQDIEGRKTTGKLLLRP